MGWFPGVMAVEAKHIEKSKLAADDEERAVLRRLSKLAERTQALLLMLGGRRAEAIAARGWPSH